ncbi:phytoene/squalene synthase family protein [Aquisalimonas sp.]|uniref:phytoene/squalene synthase family protein n=1 Tax=Aquisalimonas sp. TaxID=1872621 RepID=UPI0025C26C43|nr:phytoene/squalene synthase family protein [Aquisalimonas sp.]
MSVVERLDTGFQDRILPGVSRTFALTIPQLPEALRPAIGNAYLLCRLADTIEDASRLDTATKNECFRLLVAALERPGRGAAFEEALAGSITSVSAAEHELVAEADRVFALFHALPSEQQTPLRRCLTIMANGMAHFETLKSPQGLPDAAAFRDYCYCVAGVVGEMLTDLFAQQHSMIARAQPHMRRRAVAFAQGLQMTNILKDVWEDRAHGVCWLPRDVFARHGCSLRPGAPWHEAPEFHAGIRELVGAAHGHLREALAYTQGIPAQQRGIRRFCAWAIGMAVYTLHNIDARPDFTSAAQVKISRARLRTVIAGCNVAVLNDRLLAGAFNWAARGLPSPDSRHPGLLVTDEDTPWMHTP